MSLLDGTRPSLCSVRAVVTGPLSRPDSVRWSAESVVLSRVVGMKVGMSPTLARSAATTSPTMGNAPVRIACVRFRVRTWRRRLPRPDVR